MFLFLMAAVKVIAVSNATVPTNSIAQKFRGQVTSQKGRGSSLVSSQPSMPR